MTEFRPGKNPESKPPQTVTLGIMLLAIVVVALAVAIWRFPTGGPPGLRGTPEAVSPSEPAPPAPKTPPKAAPRTGGRAKVAPVFPMAGEIPQGMAKAELVQKFGKPNMITTAVEKGQVMETLVFIRPGVPALETVVVLKNGAVVSATFSNR